MIRSSLRIFVSFDISIPLPNYRKLKCTLGSLCLQDSFLMGPCVVLFSSPSFTRVNDVIGAFKPCYHNSRACNNEGMASPIHGVSLPSLPKDSHSGQFWLSFIYTLYPPFILSKCSPASLTCCKSPAYGGTFLMHTANERWPFHQF